MAGKKLAAPGIEIRAATSDDRNHDTATLDRQALFDSDAELTALFAATPATERSEVHDTQRHESPRRMVDRWHHESRGSDLGPFPTAFQLINNAEHAIEMPANGVSHLDTGTESRGSVGMYVSRNGAAFAVGRQASSHTLDEAESILRAWLEQIERVRRSA